MDRESGIWAVLSGMADDRSDPVNRGYVAEIQGYQERPVPPCSRKDALRLLKRFSGKSFSKFWEEPVEAYLPAVSRGIMKLSDTVYSHDEAIVYAKGMIAGLSEQELARAFLFGVAHGAPEYMTALACYYYIKNLPEHDFERKLIGSFGQGDVYSDTTCEICGYNSKLSDEPKMRFWHINVEMDFFYHRASIPHHLDLGRAIVFLREYAALPQPEASSADLGRFMEVIALIEAAPDDTTPGKLRGLLKRSGLLSMTNDQLGSFIDLLGYLDILHSEDMFGVTAGHTKERDMPDPLGARSYFAHPVGRWTRRCGIDYGSIRRLFDGIY
ncbi:MAG: hypothetical protein IJW45_01850 [Oscillospiraceae bacterium]|nr:hypothetical protein [Oscillospiraceae bacterium]